MIIGKTDKIQRVRNTLDKYNRVASSENLDVIVKAEIGKTVIKNKLGQDFIPKYKFLMDNSNIQYDDFIRILEFGGEVLDSGEEPSNIPTDGLIAQFRCETAFDGSLNPLLIDDMGNFTTDTAVSDFTFNESIKKFETSAADFPQRYISNENVGITGNSPRSISFWLYLRSRVLNDSVFGWGSPFSGEQVFGLSSNLSHTNWRIFLYPTFLTTSIPPALNVWQHILIEYDGSEMRMYIDNIPVFQQTKSINTGISPLNFGRFVSGSSMNGILDQIRVYNKVLTVEERTALFEETESVGVKTDLFPIQLINRCSTLQGTIMEVYI